VKEGTLSGRVIALAAARKDPGCERDWRSGFFEYLNERIDYMESGAGMDKLEDITSVILGQRSSILGQLTLGFVTKKYGHLLEQEWCECPGCRRVVKSRGKVKREVETIVGKFTLERPYFYCKHCNCGHYPLDEALGLSDSSKQYDIQALEAWLSSELPYNTASEAYERCTGEQLSDHHMHDVTNGIGGCLNIMDVCPTKEEIEAKIEAVSEGKFRRPVMMLGLDGAHAPTRPEPSPRKGKRGKGDWKEAKGFRLYLIDGKRIEHLISWHQIQSDKELADALLSVKGAGLIPEDKVRLGVIGDGAAWIWNRVGEIFPTAKEILDYYHCSEYIHDVAKVHYGKGTRQAQQWVEGTLTRIFYGHMDDVISGLNRMKPTSTEARKKIEDAIRYLTNHKDKANYSSAKRGGYHIGSGAIESANKFIGHTRLKRSGAWWYTTNANNILKLRSAKYNGTYDQVIEKYKQRDQDTTKRKSSKKPDLKIVK